MISLVITTYNESQSIENLVSDIMTQSLRPTELVIVDGGSTDGTQDIIHSLESPLIDAGINTTLLVRPGLNIAQGRNLAVSEATHEIICVTDAGCRLDYNWVHNITEPISSGVADFVGGFFTPVVNNAFQRTLARLTVPDTPPANFLPSSRSVAFTRDLWRRSHGYPEWLPWGEDTLFNELCLKVDSRYVVAKNALVRWEVRRTYRDVFIQYYQYAIGDGLRIRCSYSHAMNCGIPYLSAFLTFLDSPMWVLLVPLYISTVLLAASKRLMLIDLPRAILLTIVIRGARFLGWQRGFLTRILVRSSGKKMA